MAKVDPQSTLKRFRRAVQAALSFQSRVLSSLQTSTDQKKQAAIRQRLKKGS